MGGMVIKGKNISLMRGDTAVLKIAFAKNGEDYELQDGDSAYFTVKKNARSEDNIFQLTADSEGRFVFLHETTQGLKAGKYSFDVQVNLADGQVYTVCGPADFNLVADVTTDR